MGEWLNDRWQWVLRAHWFIVVVAAVLAALGSYQQSLPLVLFMAGLMLSDTLALLGLSWLRESAQTRQLR